METATAFASLKAICSGAVLLTEGGNPIILLPKFKLRAAGAEAVMDLLLHPAPHSGYTTRLFFERQIAGRGDNWSQHRVAERNWWAPSFQNVPASMPWPAMLGAHLRAVS